MSIVIDVRTALARASGRGVRVAVIDSGWDRSIADRRISHGVCLIDRQDSLRFGSSADDVDRIGHGTACINAILDIAPCCEVVPIRVFGARLETSPQVLRGAISWAVDNEMMLVNLSLGTVRNDVLRELYVVCERARAAGIVIVAAASFVKGQWSYPATFEPVIGVGHANRSPFEIEFVPGEAVECRVLASKRKVRGLCSREYLASGTSYAAPLVTGLVARVLEVKGRCDVSDMRQHLISLGSVTSENGR